MPSDLDERLKELTREPAPVDVAALWEGVRQRTADASLRGRLRALPTAVRVGLALGCAVTLAGISLAVMGTRETIADDTRLVVVLAVLVLLAIASFATSLRGLHRPNRRGATWLVVAMGLVLPFVMALVPVPLVSDVHTSALRCLLIGVGLGAVVSMPAVLAQRASVPVVSRAAATLTGGGAIAFAWLELHCPSRAVDHLVWGHALVVSVLVAVSVLVTRILHDRYESSAV